MMLQDQVKQVVATAASLLNGYPAKSHVAEDDADRSSSPRSLRDVCLEMRDKVDAFLAEEQETQLLRGVQEQLRISMGVVEEALAKYPYEQISLSYNGGKDCLVLLIMILAGLARHIPSTATSDSNPNSNTTTNGSAHSTPLPDKFQAVYIVSKHPFPEVDDFVATSSAEYHLDVTHYALPMKEGLEVYLKDRPTVKAVFVGTRRTDPHGEKLTHFDPTDAGWPQFMRVHPMIDWHYAEIWAFIRHFEIPYCTLYDQGYTSLGGTKDTHPNPHLKKTDNGNGFRPAYELMADDEERLGRDR
ncbi:FAD synthase [Cladobotryum mycophilum]|uniref:FAD synthase n=1 Tax=Cladobotryum mycophilum TaxID=491253 RepID=A0ABR0SPM7_9HYPO